MDDELFRTMDDAPLPPGVDWSMALGSAILRVLEERQPGFRDAVHARLEKSATIMEGSSNPDDVANAPDVRKLMDSWVFTVGFDHDD